MTSNAERRRDTDQPTRIRAAFGGLVQGVGFRPYVYRLAADLGLVGWVVNTPHGALAEAQGPRDRVESFVLRVQAELPPLASIQSMEVTHVDPKDDGSFEIRESVSAGARAAHIVPDIATCSECLADIRGAANRRYRYPFTNCTNCGPRFSIILALPYDRVGTTMAGFGMCSACQAEYDDPRNRRFHAQPNACPACGPHVELWDRDGAVLAAHDQAIANAVTAIMDGCIVAVKGLGGFHLVADAANDRAVANLRHRKRREEKPLALMCPTIGLAQELCSVSSMEARALLGPERPIVIMHRAEAPRIRISDLVAPGNPQLGMMLPYTPLHHLLMDELRRPIIATSGNVSDEPICTDEREALVRLSGIADLLLVHNRPIARHVDDSVLRLSTGKEQVLRRARGYAPLPVPLPAAGAVVVATGAHLKNAVALAVDGSAYVSQHIGDLDTRLARTAHARTVRDLPQLYEAQPTLLAEDMHPDYASTQEAARLATELARDGREPLRLPVQHHYAHVLSCMAEHGLTGDVLGVAWDGTGFGPDGTVWGGEWLVANQVGYRRVGHLRVFPLPGGDAAVREPRRSALGALYGCLGAACAGVVQASDCGWTGDDVATLVRMMDAGANCPLTSSAGRLFDAVASLAGVRHVNRFEGQAAMELEWAMRADIGPAEYNVEIRESDGVYIADWEPMLRRVLEDVGAGVPLAAISRGFHEALVDGIVTMAVAVGIPRVALSGGCFQNRYLAERAESCLRDAGFRPYSHQRVPPNDGGIALGQVYAARGRYSEVP